MCGMSVAVTHYHILQIRPVLILSPNRIPRQREYSNFHSLFLAVQTHRAIRVLGNLGPLLAFGIGVPAD